MIAVADKKYTLRIPEDLHAQLERIARSDMRSLHSQILVMLREAADRRARDDEQFRRDMEKHGPKR